MADTKTALAALSTGGKRVKVHDAQMVVKLPRAVKALVEEYAAGHDNSANGVVREALAEFFTRRGYDR